jgi:hypothetical protein
MIQREYSKETLLGMQENTRIQNKREKGLYSDVP